MNARGGYLTNLIKASYNNIKENPTCGKIVAAGLVGGYFVTTQPFVLVSILATEWVMDQANQNLSTGGERIVTAGAVLGILSMLAINFTQKYDDDLRWHENTVGDNFASKWIVDPAIDSNINSFAIPLITGISYGAGKLYDKASNFFSRSDYHRIEDKSTNIQEEEKETTFTV